MPVFEADFIFTIATQTGWGERKIRWRLPLARAWSYWHSALLRDGLRFRWPSAVDDWWSRVSKLFEKSPL